MEWRGVYHIHVMKTGGTSLAWMLPFPLHLSYPTPGQEERRLHEKFAPEALLAMSPEERSRFVLVSTHMGAWIAEELFPHLLSVTVLRDPLERTISHLKQILALPGSPTDLEEVYENPIWHARLVDYQTQVFAATHAQYVAQAPARLALDPARHPESERERIRAELSAAFATGIGVPTSIDEHAYAEATARLDRVHEVGVTERLGEFMDRLSARLGWTLGDVRRDRVSEASPPVPTALRERIEQESKWDRLLYERALARQAG